ncbi:MAG: rhodanese-like domain-containing protein [Thiobacillaceae bacterium]
MIKNIRPAELAAHLQTGATPTLLDVREEWEWNTCHLPGTVLISLRELPGRVAELDKTVETVVICHHGVRSHHAALYLKSLGFTDVINLSGGMAAWADEVDPAMPRY